MGEMNKTTTRSTTSPADVLLVTDFDAAFRSALDEPEGRPLRQRLGTGRMVSFAP
jgi:hypothetical protein